MKLANDRNELSPQLWMGVSQQPVSGDCPDVGRGLSYHIRWLPIYNAGLGAKCCPSRPPTGNTVTTTCYITIDTEYGFRFTRQHGPGSRAENFARSIICSTPAGEVGIRYQMRVLDEYGLKAVFFVDPMPAVLWGTAAIEDVVGPIVDGGHDVQLHMHTAWLEFAKHTSPTEGRTGINIKDFSFEDQCTLVDYAKSILVAAGANPPVAFRAGNYGASDTTLRALAMVGIRYDTSFCPGISASACAINLARTQHLPVEYCGVVEVPIGCIANGRTALRHAQLTALSAIEMGHAIRHSATHGVPYFTLVSHSFELLSSDRSRINRLVRGRFLALCDTLAKLPSVHTGTYASHPPQPATAEDSRINSVLPFNPLRAGIRVAEQLVSNALYYRQ
jgi:hypothetical protein